MYHDKKRNVALKEGLLKRMLGLHLQTFGHHEAEQAWRFSAGVNRNDDARPATVDESQSPVFTIFAGLTTPTLRSPQFS